MPIDLVPDDSEEGAALIAVVDMYSIGELPMRGGVGALLEQFRDTPHEPVLARAAQIMDDDALDESVDETVFRTPSQTAHRIRKQGIQKPSPRKRAPPRSRRRSDDDTRTCCWSAGTPANPKGPGFVI